MPVRPLVRKSFSKGVILQKKKTTTTRHGCGLVFDSQSCVDRKARDQFDYHEQQQCPLLPRLVCPLECHFRGKLLSFAGPKALRQHYKTKSHLAVAESKAASALLTSGGSFDVSNRAPGPPKLEADYAPEQVHGDPRTKGFRSKKREIEFNETDNAALPASVSSASRRKSSRGLMQLDELLLALETVLQRRSSDRAAKAQTSGALARSVLPELAWGYARTLHPGTLKDQNTASTEKKSSYELLCVNKIRSDFKNTKFSTF